MFIKLLNEKRFNLFLILTFMISLLFGFALVEAASEVDDSRVFINLARNNPSTLDAHTGFDGTNMKIFFAVYEPLIDHTLGTSSKEKLVGILAEDWNISDDGTEYTFQLREGVKFHDGSVLDADVVITSLERIMELGLGNAWVLDPVSEISAVDSMTVKITLDSPYSPFILGLPQMYIISQDAIENHEVDGDYAKNWLNINEAGSGPYKLENWAMGESLTLTKFEDHWGGWDHKHVDKIALRFVGEPATQRMMMEGGEGNWADTISARDLNELDDRDDFFATSDPTFDIFFLMMDTHQAPLNDPRVRQAMRLAYPYKEVVEDILEGRAAYAKGYLPPDFWSHDGSPIEHTDLEEAKRLLAEAGIKEGITLTARNYAPFDFQRQALELFDSNLRELGIKLDIQGESWATLVELMLDPERRPHFTFFSSKPDTAHPDSTFYKTFHSSSGHWSRLGYKNEEIDRLLEEARKTVDPEEQKALYHKVQAVLQEDSPAILSHIALTDHLFSSNVRGYVHHPLYGYAAINFTKLYLEE